MDTLRVEELAAQLRAGKDILLVDVRSPQEYRSGHIPNAINIPVEQAAFSALVLADSRPLILICQKGGRAAQVYTQLESMRSNMRVLHGGTTEWQRQRQPLEGTGSGVWSLERQIRFTAGLLTLLGAAGSLMWHPLLTLAIIVGGGLMFTSAINWCGMGLVLAKMPWNRRNGQNPSQAAGAKS